jgi:hypothetical protein
LKEKRRPLFISQNLQARLSPPTVDQSRRDSYDRATADVVKPGGSLSVVSCSTTSTERDIRFISAGPKIDANGVSAACLPTPMRIKPF